MPSKDTKKMKFNQHHKCEKGAAIIFENCESLLKKQMDAKII